MDKEKKAVNQEEELKETPMMIGIITKEYGALPFLMTGEEYEEYLKDLSENNDF